MKSISDIKHAFYINLDARSDRKSHVEKQLETIGIQAERFNAIKLKNGALGCSMSHLKCLETAKKNNWDHVVIVEDDILFTKPDLFKKQLSFFLKNHDNFDVILLAGNNASRHYIKVDHSCVKVYNCQTTTGYLVKSHYYDTLIQNYKDGIQKLLKEPENHKLYAIDKYWFRLQEKDNWYLIMPLSVVQREDYSDIEKRTTNYKNIMLDLDKPWLMQNASLQQLLPMPNEIKKPSQKISMKLM
jgi:GR25 family glycosyltransferase involved in LPS biosynthesis